MSIRVLQLSGLHVDADESTPDEWVGELREGLASFQERPIDYVAICGGLTRHGTAREFEQAEAVLEQIERVLLTSDGGGGRAPRQRIVIVPGYSDAHVGDQVDHKAFCDFYDRYFAQQIHDGSMRRYEPAAANLRQLKDLTFIGVSHWGYHRALSSSRLLGALADTLRAISSHDDRPPDLEYVKSKPTLLLSAETPIFESELPASLEFQQLREAVLAAPAITLHLVGSGSFWCVPRQPFGLDYITVSTGPVVEQMDFRVRRMNLIEFSDRMADEYGWANGSAFIRVSAFLKRSRNDPWRSEPFVDGHLDPFVLPPREEVERRADSAIYRNLTRALEDTIRAGNGLPCALVTGFPGSGKRSFAEYLATCNRFLDQDVEASHLYLRNWRKPGDWVQQFDQHIDNLTIRCKLFGRRGMIIISSVRLPVARSADAVLDRFSEILDIVDRAAREDLICIVFLGQTAVYRIPESDIPMFQLSPLEDEEYGLLAYRRFSRVPLRSQEMRLLTGNFIGYTDIIAEGAGTWFDEAYAGHDPVGPATSANLIRRALEADKTTREIEAFFEHFELRHGADRVLEYIRTRVTQQLDQSTRLPAARIELDQREFEDHLDLPKDRVKILLNLLRKERVLSPKVGAGDALRYTLTLPLPFLTPSRSFRVFFSYGREMADEAEKLAIGLRALAQRAGDVISIYDYRDPSQPRDPGRSINEKLHAELRQCPNLIWLHDGSERIVSATVNEELQAWKEIWLDRTTSLASVYPITFAEDPHWPPMIFQDRDKFNWPREVDEVLLEEIYRTLISRDMQPAFMEDAISNG